MLIFKIASQRDFEIIAKRDKHISREILKDKIDRVEVYVTHEDEKFAGWIRYGLFWDNTPFMNMLHLLPEHRGKGIGRKFVQYWEQEMKVKGYKKVLTSTQQNEHAQHFYLALGYIAIGGFIQTSGALAEDSFEIMLAKEL